MNVGGRSIGGRLAYAVLGASLCGILVLARDPAPEEEVALGTVVIPPALYAKKKEDFGKVSGTERLTRKEADPILSAYAPGAERELVTRFIAPLLEQEPPAADPLHLPADPQLAVTTCLGTGASVQERLFPLRRTETTILAACNDLGGRVWKYEGASPEWAHAGDSVRVSASRLAPLVNLSERGLAVYGALQLLLGLRDLLNH